MIKVYFTPYETPETFPDYLIGDLSKARRVYRIEDKETGRILYDQGVKDLDQYPFRFRGE